MAAYLSPGIFVEEMNTGGNMIQAVGTQTAGFVGTAPNPEAGLNEAIAIDNWAQFERTFIRKDDPSTDLANAVKGFFVNGGSRCYVANVPANGPIAGKGGGLDALNLIDEIAIIAAPGRTDVRSQLALLDAAEALKDRFAILDAPADVDNVEALTRAASVGTPDPDAPKPPKGQGPGLRPRDSEGGYGAIYYPWLRVPDAVTGEMVSAPPSGHMAGIYARTDSERGVHKAPANATIRGAINPTKIVSRAEQDVLNPAGINVIRFFTREGTKVWGARTLAPPGQWQYINVRRLFLMIEESIATSTRWVVFEPNDRPLWKAIQRDVGAFLTLLWRQGAMAGSRPQDAFFVKCDEETNPPEVVDSGQVVIVIGIAPVKPAEFVIFRIGQKPTEATTSEGA